MESFFCIDPGPTVCSSVHVPKVLAFTHRIQSWCGCSCSHLPRSPYDYMVVLCCVLFIVSVSLLLLSTMLYMYIHTIHRAVLDQSFVCLFSSFVPHCHQLSIVGEKESEFLK